METTEQGAAEVPMGRTRAPKVSVVIPAYDVAEFLGNAISSVLAQEYSDLEIIVVDDGSSDGTANAVPRLPFVQYVRRERGGPAAARNTGLRLAQGEYIAFLDADDMWEPLSLRRRLRFMERNPRLGLVFGDVCFFDEHGVIVSSHLSRLRAFRQVPSTESFPGCHVFLRSVAEETIMEPFIPIDTVLVRRQSIQAVGFFDESLWVSEDTDLWYRISRQCTVGYIDDVLARCRRRPGSVTSDRERLLEYRLRATGKFLSHYSSTDGEVARMLQERLGRMYVELGEQRLAHGQLRDARQCFVAGLRYRSARRSSLLRLFASCVSSRIRRALVSVYRRLRSGRWPQQEAWFR